MPVLEDYYRILQVHFLAEPEVIESAYKRLAKKYHPDVNKTLGADFRMKKINEAYDTLRDDEKRKAYDAERHLHREMPRAEAPRAAPYQRSASNDHQEPKQDADSMCPAAAKEALGLYFASLKERDYAAAYDLVSAMDKNNIHRGDFIQWQSGVARIYILQEYTFKAEKIEQSCRLNGTVYPLVVEFAVSTVEHNAVMGRQEKDTISKKVVLENKAWRIYVGFEDVQPYIARFDELNGLLTAKSAINDMVEHYSYKDSVSGLYNKKGFSEAAQREVLRYTRYGNVFSVMLLELDPAKDLRREKNQEMARYAASWAGKILSGNFRQLDILGRWGEMGYIILLPETNLSGCFKAAKKIKNIFEVTPFIYNKRQQQVRISIGIEEFNGSLDDTIRNLSGYISVAGKSRRNCIAYRGGIFE